ncbi:MAG: aminopeptidase [Holophagales bacterium]|nr:aminopeptidase [Holophagales bacterium]MYG28990.1 aminopeptidase [Holophagales bacterium]MYI80690.1 aminopeptidase [Holophagales bacterium]
MTRQASTRKWRARRPLRRRPRVLAVAAVVAVAGLVASCSSVRYYSQAVWGGADVLVKRKSIDRLLESGRAQVLSAATRERLRLSQEIRDFASRELGLPDNRSYRSYADLGRPYAVWNVVAAPRLDLSPKTWCYPFAGCAAYRGYFNERAARRHGDRLAADGFDVRVGGVAAYSTLGWFADPVLNTFLDYAEADLAALIFHELAHQVLYVKDDSAFNESFATAVEVEGVRRWLRSLGRDEELAAFESARRRRRDLNRYLLDVRAELESIYGSDDSDERKLARKAELFRALPSRYRRELVPVWREAGDDAGGESNLGEWLSRLNNADLVAVATYNDLVPAFRALLEASGDSLPAFYVEVERLVALEPEERRRALESLATGRPAPPAPGPDSR